MSLVDEIEAIRRRNNILWMDILRLALQYASTKTKAVLKEINANDKQISKLIGKLSK